MCGGVYLRKEIRQTSSSLVAQIAVPVSCDTVSMLESFSKPDMLGLVSVPNCARKPALDSGNRVELYLFTGRPPLLHFSCKWIRQNPIWPPSS